MNKNLAFCTFSDILMMLLNALTYNVVFHIFILRILLKLKGVFHVLTVSSSMTNVSISTFKLSTLIHSPDAYPLCRFHSLTN